MIAFAYEAGGDGNDASDDVVVWTFDKDGIKTEELWYKAPFCGMIHDCGISENYVVLPLTPIKASVERLKKGGNHFAVSCLELRGRAMLMENSGIPKKTNGTASCHAEAGNQMISNGSSTINLRLPVRDAADIAGSAPPTLSTGT